MANPWSILGVRRTCDAEQLWNGYAETLRRTSDERQRRRARDAFEAIDLGLWGRFADSVDPDRPETDIQASSISAFDGPLADRLAELDRLLSGAGATDEIQVRDRIDALFDDEAMQFAETYLHVEAALAELLERNLPRSEFILPFALDHFRHLTEQARDNPLIARLMDRAADVELLSALEAGGAVHSKGWRALRKPASPFQRWLWARDDRRAQVAALYSYAGWFNPKIRRRIDPAEWTWWSQELSRDRISFSTLVAWLVAAVLMGVAAHRYRAPTELAVTIGAATFAFLLVDCVVGRRVTALRSPKPFDGPWVPVFALAALLLPAFTRLLAPDLISAAIVAGLALSIAWALRLATGLAGGVRSSGWPDFIGIPTFIILSFALSLSIPWERYAILASYVWLLHAILPDLRRPVAMALERLASLNWGILIACTGAALGLAAVFAAELDINRESTRLALLITGYALFSLSIHFRRPFPSFFALVGCVLIGGYFIYYCEGGGEYHPGPSPSVGETLLSAERGDVLDWGPFPANGEDVLARMKRNNPDAYERLMPVIRRAKCENGRDGTRECEAYVVDGAANAELGRLLATMSNRHLAEFTKLELRTREAQYRSRSGACSTQAPIFDKLSPRDIRHDHGALVLDIIASGPRPLSERPNVPLPDQPTFERALEEAYKSAVAIEGGPLDPRLKQACIGQMVRARAILHFGTDVAARISRGGYPQ